VHGRAGKAMTVARRGYPRSSGTPCPAEERPRQAGLLAHGSTLSGRLLETFGSNGAMAGSLAAYSCRGSAGVPPNFPFHPLTGNLSHWRW